MSVEDEVAWVLSVPSIHQARTRFQQKKLESEDPTRLHALLWPLLYGIEGEEERKQRFADARRIQGHG